LRRIGGDTGVIRNPKYAEQAIILRASTDLLSLEWISGKGDLVTLSD
jgi:hypothetical protein